LLPSCSCIAGRASATRATKNITAGPSAAFGKKITGAVSTLSVSWQQFIVQAAMPALPAASCSQFIPSCSAAAAGAFEAFEE